MEVICLMRAARGAAVRSVEFGIKNQISLLRTQISLLSTAGQCPACRPLIPHASVKNGHKQQKIFPGDTIFFALPCQRASGVVHLIASTSHCFGTSPSHSTPEGLYFGYASYRFMGCSRWGFAASFPESPLKQSVFRGSG